MIELMLYQIPFFTAFFLVLILLLADFQGIADGLYLIDKQMLQSRGRKQGKKMYKSQYSPIYYNYNPMLERLIQSKLRLLNRQNIHLNQNIHKHINTQSAINNNSKAHPCINGTAKTLLIRNNSSQSNARERRSIVALSERPKTTPLIVRSNSQGHKILISPANTERMQDDEDDLLESTFKRTKVRFSQIRRQV